VVGLCVNPDELQLLDETNTEWVRLWKKALKKH